MANAQHKRILPAGKTARVTRYAQTGTYALRTTAVVRSRTAISPVRTAGRIAIAPGPSCLTAASLDVILDVILARKTE